MKKEQFETGKAPHVTVECLGDLDVRTWGEAAVNVKGSHHQVTEQENGLAIRSEGDLRLTVPAGTRLTINTAHGDLIIKNVEGGIEIDQVLGDAALRAVGPVGIQRVHGDLSARDVAGSCSVEEVLGDASIGRAGDVNIGRAHGDCAIRYVNGGVNLAEVLGDAGVKNVRGGVNIGRCHRDVSLRALGGNTNVGEALGDIRLRGSLAAGKHNLNAHGDIIVRWPAGHPVSVIATGREVIDRLGMSRTQQNGSFVGQLGESDTSLILNAKGRIILKAVDGSESWDSAEDSDFDAIEVDLEAELEGIGQRISSEINSKMAELHSRMGEITSRLEGKFGPEFGAKIEAKALKAAARAERQAERAIRNFGSGRGRSWTSTFTPAASPVSAKEKKATEEEQLRILKMVENGVISPDEATTLLDALAN